MFESSFHTTIAVLLVFRAVLRKNITYAENTYTQEQGRALGTH